MYIDLNSISTYPYSYLVKVRRMIFLSIAYAANCLGTGTLTETCTPSPCWFIHILSSFTLEDGPVQEVTQPVCKGKICQYLCVRCPDRSIFISCHFHFVDHYTN